MSAWYYHVCETLYLISGKFLTLKKMSVRCALFTTLLIHTILQQCLILKIVFFLKKSKYYVCVILSRLCDTLNVMDVQVSRRRDSITQTWYFNFLRKKTIFKITHCWRNVWISKVLKRAHLTDIFFSVKNLPEIKYHVCVIHSITQTWFGPNWFQWGMQHSRRLLHHPHWGNYW